MVHKSENYKEDEELIESARGRKLRKKARPRPRGYALRKKKKLEIERSRENEVELAEGKIARHLAGFPDLNSAEGRIQAKRYLSWAVDSLFEEGPVIRDEDLEFKTAVASVKAGGQQRQKTRSSVRVTHLPTLISARNEEERNFEQNKKRVHENLLDRLSEHFSLLQTLSKNSPNKFSLSEIEKRGIDLLEELK